MRTFTAIIERCPVTGHYVGHVPALPGTCEVAPENRTGR